MNEIDTKIHALHAWIDREEAHSRHVLGNTKMVTTFSAGLAATFVATAVQIEGSEKCDLAAGIALAVALLLTFVLITMKRRTAIEAHTIRNEPIDALGNEAVQAATDNVRRANKAHVLMVGQVALCILSCGIAMVPILRRGL